VQIISVLISVSKHHRNAHKVLFACHGELITLECFNCSCPTKCGLLIVNVSSNNSVDIFIYKVN